MPQTNLEVNIMSTFPQIRFSIFRYIWVCVNLIRTSQHRAQRMPLIFLLVTNLVWGPFISTKEIGSTFFCLYQILYSLIFLSPIVFSSFYDFLQFRLPEAVGGTVENIALDAVSTHFMLHLVCRKMNTRFSNSHIFLK